MHSIPSLNETDHGLLRAGFRDTNHERMACDWQALCEQLLKQWSRLTPRDLKQTGPSRRGLAMLVHKKYGVAPEAAENYLLNIERFLPLQQPT